jgi:hypothetical protein
MSLNKKIVSIPELKKLLFELNDRKSYISIRVRLIGQMWEKSFMHIAAVYDDGVLLHDDHSGRFLNITRLSNIMQFEIDHSFHIYQPHDHFEVIPDEAITQSKLA